MIITIIEYILGKILGNHDYRFYFFTGYYMLVEGATGTFLSRARMETPVLGSTGPSCQLQFYYHMFGLGAGKIIRICHELICRVDNAVPRVTIDLLSLSLCMAYRDPELRTMRLSNPKMIVKF